MMKYIRMCTTGFLCSFHFWLKKPQRCQDDDFCFTRFARFLVLSTFIHTWVNLILTWDDISPQTTSLGMVVRDNSIQNIGVNYKQTNSLGMKHRWTTFSQSFWWGLKSCSFAKAFRVYFFWHLGFRVKNSTPRNGRPFWFMVYFYSERRINEADPSPRSCCNPSRIHGPFCLWPKSATKKWRDFLTPETKRGTTNSSKTQVRDLCFLKYFGGLHVFVFR